MMAAKETSFTRDATNRKLHIVREFDGSLDQVWKAWTERALLDQWWAPRPWKAHTQSMDFRNGGLWLYYMQGPDDARHYCRVDYHTIIPNKSFTGVDSFCDENGHVSTEMPGMNWKCVFSSSGNGTKVEVEVTFDTEADMDKIIEMGFKEGFAAAHGNLDELLAG